MLGCPLRPEDETHEAARVHHAYRQRTMTSRAKRIALALAISLLSALLARSMLPPAALAQSTNDGECPLSHEQSRKSAEAFNKIAEVFTGQPRCVNCHGAVNPFGPDAYKTHGGGIFFPIMKTEPNPDTGEPETSPDIAASFQPCKVCHDAFPGTWTTAPPNLSFVGKDAFTLCTQQRDRFSDARDFIKHIETDADPSTPFVQEAFTGRMGLNTIGRSLAKKFPAPPVGVTHQDLIQMAHDWVDALGGKFQGGRTCGCPPESRLSFRGRWPGLSMRWQRFLKLLEGKQPHAQKN